MKIKVEKENVKIKTMKIFQTIIFTIVKLQANLKF